MDNTFEKRKKIIYDLICDDFYVPMKIKEIAFYTGYQDELYFSKAFKKKYGISPRAFRQESGSVREEPS